MKTLNDWMDSNEISPEKAAEIFGKSVGTIRNWRSAGVPTNQKEWVEKRMVEWNGKPLPEVPDRVTLEVSPHQFDAWNHAALAEGKILRKWAIDALEEAAAADPTLSDPAVDPVPSVPALRVAEDPPLSRDKLAEIQRNAAAMKAAKLAAKLQPPTPSPPEPPATAANHNHDAGTK